MPWPIGGSLTSLTATTLSDSAGDPGQVPLGWTRGPEDPEGVSAWIWPSPVDENDMLDARLTVSAGSGAYAWHVEIDVSTAGDERRTVGLPARGTWTSSSSGDSCSTDPGAPENLAQVASRAGTSMTVPGQPGASPTGVMNAVWRYSSPFSSYVRRLGAACHGASRAPGSDSTPGRHVDPPDAPQGATLVRGRRPAVRSVRLRACR